MLEASHELPGLVYPDPRGHFLRFSLASAQLKLRRTFDFVCSHAGISRKFYESHGQRSWAEKDRL